MTTKVEFLLKEIDQHEMLRIASNLFPHCHNLAPDSKSDQPLTRLAQGQMKKEETMVLNRNV
jgi:hypothetical protein